ncbi:MAG TPA: glyoxalase, partial [Alteromonas sp.]|nr:glyoxalase [Alteromonas sp.]
MNIIGPDLLVFGVDDVDACRQFASDYGLTASGDHRFVALDGTGIEIRSKDDDALPTALETGSMLRKTVYGVADQAT